MQKKKTFKKTEQLIFLGLCSVLLSSSAHADTFKPAPGEEKAITATEMRTSNWEDLRQERADQYCLRKQYIRAKKLRTDRPNELSSEAVQEKGKTFRGYLDSWIAQNGDKTFYFTEIHCTNSPKQKESGCGCVVEVPSIKFSVPTQTASDSIAVVQPFLENQQPQPALALPGSPSSAISVMPPAAANAENKMISKLGHAGPRSRRNSGMPLGLPKLEGIPGAKTPAVTSAPDRSIPKNNSASVPGKKAFPKLVINRLASVSPPSSPKSGSLKPVDKSLWKFDPIPSPQELAAHNRNAASDNIMVTLFRTGPASDSLINQGAPIAYQFTRPQLRVDLSPLENFDYEIPVIRLDESPRSYYTKRMQSANSPLIKLERPIASGRQSTVFRNENQVVKFKAPSMHGISKGSNDDLGEMALQAKKDMMMAEFVDQYANAFKVDGKNPIRVLKYEMRPDELSKGISRQPFQSGRNAFRIAELIHLAKSHTPNPSGLTNSRDATPRGSEEARAALNEEFGSMDEAIKQVRILETFYRMINSDALNFQDKYGLPHASNGINKMTSLDVGVDFNHGINVKWDKDGRIWSIFDF